MARSCGISTLGIGVSSAWFCVAVIISPAPAFAQPPEAPVAVTSAPAAARQPAAPVAPDPPAIRRWLDVQSVHAGSRFRWFRNSQDVLRSSTLQWQSQLRARFLFDRAGRYSIGTLASTGSAFPSSWNNTGGGIGDFTHPFNVKQLFLSAEPVEGLELQAGGLFMNRGELGEHITYDNDAYIVGERVSYRPAGRRVTQISIAAGYFGDYHEVNVFRRLDRMNDFNYGQALIAIALHPQVSASVDYTYEDGRDIMREGVNVRLPPSVKPLTAVRLETYQRVADRDGHGFNASADARWRKFSLTAGVMSVDRDYGPFNGDRYETGRRQYTIGTFQITPELSIGWFQTEAFLTEFPINLKRRFDVLVMFNPTATLKRAGVF